MGRITRSISSQHVTTHGPDTSLLPSPSERERELSTSSFSFHTNTQCVCACVITVTRDESWTCRLMQTHHQPHAFTQNIFLSFLHTFPSHYFLVPFTLHSQLTSPRLRQTPGQKLNASGENVGPVGAKDGHCVACLLKWCETLPALRESFSICTQVSSIARAVRKHT